MYALQIQSLRYLWSATAGRRTPKTRIDRWLLASIAKCAATLGSRFKTLARGSPPVLERAKSGAWRLRVGLSTSRNGTVFELLINSHFFFSYIWVREFAVTPHTTTLAGRDVLA